jgi:hypothetical protein
MKNKILASLFVLVIAAVAAFNVNLNQPKSELSDLSLANVEALAQEARDPKPSNNKYTARWWDCFNTKGEVIGKKKNCDTPGFSANCTKVPC